MRAKTETAILIIIFLCGLTGFSIYKYAGINRELSRQKRHLAELNERNTVITRQLEEERAHLAQLREQKKFLEEEVALGKENLGQVKAELLNSQEELAILRRTVEELTAANQGLNQEQANLKAKIDALSSEKNALDAKISSIDELKKMIKDLVKAKRAQNRTRAVVKTGITKEIKEGNRGYVIYQGKPTYNSKLSIQVIPVDN